MRGEVRREGAFVPSARGDRGGKRPASARRGKRPVGRRGWHVRSCAAGRRGHLPGVSRLPPPRLRAVRQLPARRGDPQLLLPARGPGRARRHHRPLAAVPGVLRLQGSAPPAAAPCRRGGAARGAVRGLSRRARPLHRHGRRQRVGLHRNRAVLGSPPRRASPRRGRALARTGGGSPPRAAAARTGADGALAGERRRFRRRGRRGPARAAARRHLYLRRPRPERGERAASCAPAPASSPSCPRRASSVRAS